jgi:hypothetical protein
LDSMGGPGDDANRAPAVYGLGMQVDIAKRTFKVLRVSQLEDASGKSLNHNVNVGDELVAADGTVLQDAVARGVDIVEDIILGSRGSQVRLSLKSKEGRNYEVTATRHVHVRGVDHSACEARIKGLQDQLERANSLCKALSHEVSEFENANLKLKGSCDRYIEEINLLNAQMGDQISRETHLADLATLGTPQSNVNPPRWFPLINPPRSFPLIPLATPTIPRLALAGRGA